MTLAQRLAPALARREREAEREPHPSSAERYRRDREARDARIAALRTGTIGRGR